MVKPEWGTKRTCPKCGTRFYDLGKEDPVTCISCGIQWEPEPVLKSKQPLPFDAPKPVDKAKPEPDSDLSEDMDIGDDDEESADDDNDLGGDDDDLDIAKRENDDEQ